MEFIFLGTSAGEQYPGFWCRCANCNEARRRGGKNIRKNSCAWISPDCLIDFPAEIFSQAERFNVPILETQTLLITHSHEDHLFPYLFAWRRMPVGTKFPPENNLVGPRFSELKTLRILGNKTTCSKARKYLKSDLSEYAITLTEAEPFREYKLENMKVIPLLANHPDGDENGLNYIIEKEGKVVLYALDTGWFLPCTESEIKKHKFDLVVLEGTFGYGNMNEKTHFNFKKLFAAYALFKNAALLKKDGVFCVSHLCPHFSPIHDDLAPEMLEKGIAVAYDGLKIKSKL